MATVALTPKALDTIEELERHHPSTRGRRSSVVEVALALYLHRRMGLPDPPSANEPLPDVVDDWPFKKRDRKSRVRGIDPIIGARARRR